MDTDAVRQQMVEQQVRTWDVFDAQVLDAIAGVPRVNFVPAELKDCAYADTEIPLGHGQCMLRPSIVGKALQAVDILPHERVLEVGTGTGYLTTCIARLAGSVVSVDLFDDFIDGARQRLSAAGVGNVELETMDASVRLPQGPFDVIVVTASMTHLDPRMTAALKPGGRLFIVIGRSPAMTATLVSRGADDHFTCRDLFETDIPALITADEPRIFAF